MPTSPHPFEFLTTTTSWPVNVLFIARKFTREDLSGSYNPMRETTCASKVSFISRNPRDIHHLDSFHSPEAYADPNYKAPPRTYVNTILLQALQNLNSEAFSKGRPTASQAIAALDGHLKSSPTFLHRTILDLPSLEETDQSPLSKDLPALHIWGTNKIFAPHGTIGYNEWHLRWFKHRLLK